MKAKSSPFRLGFTLMEVLAVVSIIAISSSVAYVAADRVRSVARDNKRIADLTQIQVALTLYKEQSMDREYPDEGPVINSDFKNALQSYIAPFPAFVSTGISTTYASEGRRYWGVAHNNHTEMILVTVLEGKNASWCLQKGRCACYLKSSGYSAALNPDEDDKNNGTGFGIAKNGIDDDIDQYWEDQGFVDCNTL